jgi:hypothetical protein
MRKAFSKQRRLDCPAVGKVALNYECRDEIVPILRAMQELAQQPILREKVLAFIEQDVCRTGSDAAVQSDAGREGLSYGEILVLSAVRLGGNLNYDKLQDLAENHRNLRHVMGVGDWPTESSLLIDGWEQIYKRALPLVEQFGGEGWRKHEHRLRKANRTSAGDRASPRDPTRTRAERGQVVQLARTPRAVVQTRQGRIAGAVWSSVVGV